MKKLGLISVGLFVVSLLVYGIWFSNENVFNGKTVMFIAAFLPIIGLITAFKGKGV